MKKTTLIIPTLNAEKYIDETLTSLKKNKKYIYETLFIDGGSKDKTKKKIISNFSKYKFIRKKNLNIAKSLNYGIKISKTNYISRLDSDDIALKNRFKKQIDFLEKNKNYALIGSNFNTFNDNKIFNQKSLPNSYDDIVLRFLITGDITIAHPTVTLRKKYLDPIKPYGYLDYSEDYSLWIKLIFKKYKIANLKDNLNLIRVHNNQKSSIYKKESYNCMKNCYLMTMRKNKIKINKNYVDCLMIKYLGDVKLTNKSIKEFYNQKIFFTNKLIKYFNIKINVFKIQKYELENINFQLNYNLFKIYFFYKKKFLKKILKNFKINLIDRIFLNFQYYFFSITLFIKFFIKKKIK